jgi:hypothetical protein
VAIIVANGKHNRRTWWCEGFSAIQAICALSSLSADRQAVIKEGWTGDVSGRVYCRSQGNDGASNI